MPSHDIPRPSPVSSASQQGLKARRSRRSLDSFESYEELRDYVLNHYRIDDKWRWKIVEGKARIVVNGDGVWICGSSECYRLIRKIEGLNHDVYRLLRALLDGPKTVHQLLAETMIPYYRLKRYLYYYKQALLLLETPLGYVLNEDHPQFNSLKNIIISSLFFKGTDSNRLLQILTDSHRLSSSESVNKETNKETSSLEDKLVEEARKLARIDETEERVLRAIIRVILPRVEVGFKPWFYFDTWEELRERLNIDNISTDELRYIIKRLENSGILYTAYDKKKNRFGVRIHVVLAKRAGLEK